MHGPSADHIALVMAYFNHWSMLLLLIAIPIVTLFFIQIPRKPKTQRSRKFGLQQVYPDPKTPIEDERDMVDIVAIHGLDSQSPTAWIAWKEDGNPKSGNVHWLKDPDMLPAKIRTDARCRIYTYDWAAGVGRDASIASMFHHSTAFLNEIRDARKETRTSTRPIIFVASCFGGLILAKALVEASGHLENGKYNDIVRFTVGVAFLGTPFQGTHQFLYEFTLLRIAAAIDAGEESSQELAKYLRHGSERGTLDELVSKFCQLKDNPHYKFPVVCFFEELRTDFKSFSSRLPLGVKSELDGQHSAVLVDHSSAILQGVPSEGLPVRHNMLNKFNSPDNAAFRKVYRKLNDFIEQRRTVLESKS